MSTRQQKRKEKRLKARQDHYDSLPTDHRAAGTKPGSLSGRK